MLSSGIADINAQAAEGNTPLHRSAELGSKKISPCSSYSISPFIFLSLHLMIPLTFLGPVLALTLAEIGFFFSLDAHHSVISLLL